MSTICVYLGACFGISNTYREKVIELGHEIAARDLTLIYGGSSLGMMGLLATTVKQQGGKVIGVITEHLLDKEFPLNNLNALHVVNSMQERKKMLQELSDSFIVMPGGLGTLEEAIETWNAIKIGELNKKIGFLNIDNYFNKLFDFISCCQSNGFITAFQATIPIVHYEPSLLLNELTYAQTEYVPRIDTVTLT